MLHTFLLKRTFKTLYNDHVLSIQITNGKDLTTLFKMGLSRTINKLSLICKLELLESLDKMMKS